MAQADLRLARRMRTPSVRPPRKKGK
jgi:hypothetical protein